MASKVLVPGPPPFTKLQVKKSPPDAGGPGFIISGDPAARVSHLEHSVRFLQEQHRQMLSGLHAEIEALRERNRDLQFQLIFNKEPSPKPLPVAEDPENSEEAKLKREVARLEKEAAAARSEARAAEARALHLQKMIDAQAEKLRSTGAAARPSGRGSSPESECGAGLRARLADAERLVRRLRADADCRRREVGAAGATNLLFDGAAASHAHLQCMKNSLHASLRATGLDQYGYQNNYHFPPLHTPEFWREPIRDEYGVSRGRGRRPLTLPELSGPTLNRPANYTNNHSRPRANGYDRNKRQQSTNGDVSNVKSSEEHVSNGQSSEGPRPRPRRQHRKHAPEQT